MKLQNFSTSLLFLCCAAANAQTWEGKDAKFPNPNTFIAGIVTPTKTTAWTYGSEYDLTTGQFTGQHFTISKTTDGGQNWQQVDFPHTEPGYFSHVSALNENVAWLAYIDYTNGNKIMKTTDGGLTWTEQSNGITVWVNFVHFFDGTFGVAMGDPGPNGFEIFTSVDGGENWNPVNAANIPANLPGEFGYSGFFEVHGNKIWFETSAGRIYYSPNKGFTWEVINGPESVPYTCLGADDAGAIYLSYTPDPSAPVLTFYRSFDNGATWEDITPDEDSIYIVDIEPVPGTGAIIAQWATARIPGSPTDTRISYDQGSTWQTIATGNDGLWLSFFDDETGYLTEWQFQDDPQPVQVYSYIGESLTGLFERKPLNVSLLASPNPATDFINVALDAPTASEFTLLLNDANGRLLRKMVFEKTASFTEEIDLRALPPGAYTLTISSKEGMLAKQFVKQ